MTDYRDIGKNLQATRERAIEGKKRSGLIRTITNIGLVGCLVGLGLFSCDNDIKRTFSNFPQVVSDAAKKRDEKIVQEKFQLLRDYMKGTAIANVVNREGYGFYAMVHYNENPLLQEYMEKNNINFETLVDFYEDLNNNEPLKNAETRARLTVPSWP